MGHFACPGAGVVEEKKEGVISLSLGTTAIGCGQERVDFFLLEVGYGGPNTSAERDTLNLSDLIEEFWELSGDESAEGVDCGEPLVSSRHGVGAIVLQVGQEVANEVCRDLFDGHSDRISRVVLVNEAEQEANSIPVAPLGVEAEVAVGNEVLE
jgi:hypothetical protein